MFVNLLRYLFNKNDREVRKYRLQVEKINSFEPEISALSDEELKAKTDYFRNELSNGKELSDIVEEAFAVVREASKRTIGLRHFDVQMIGGLALYEGKVIEMKTGEGKTLVATLPAYIYGLTGKGVHVVTVNDYLASRDCEWMGQIYRFLGLTVDVILHDKPIPERKQAYQADIIYGTNNEFGFDYLRDNMVVDIEDCVQREHHFCIIDEVDSILIDEARTPLIISGPTTNSKQQYFELKPLIQNLVKTQQRLMDSLITQAKKLLSEEKLEEAGLKLLLVSKGDPKNRQLMTLFEDVKIRKLVEDTELEIIRDKRQEVYESLYYQVDEKGHSIDLNDKGRELISSRGKDLFTIPDLSQIQEEIIGLKNQLSNKSTEESEKDAILAKLNRKEEEFAELERKHQLASERIHNVSQLLKAYVLFEKDVDYVVQDNKVVIVDEFTGRLMPGRRYSDGLHQALEAKESIKIEGETQTLATITLQNYFRMYDKMSGMTGTAATEAAEFKQIYKMDTVIIPTNKPIARKDMPDSIFKTEREKYEAIAETIVSLHSQGQPVLVGTTSIEKSEKIGNYIKARGITNFNILNAKYHEKEAEIISNAGEYGAITIATNMAGRGTDIVLDDKSKEAGGLFVLGTERHESRRIDNQLRGRSGRQGDPGASQFILSLEDELLRLFGGDNLVAIMDKLGMEEGVPIENRLVSNALERAQKRVESRNFQIRKHVLEYDDVMNKQREVIYSQRREVLEQKELKDNIFDMVEDVLIETMDEYLKPDYQEYDSDLLPFIRQFNIIFPVPINPEELKKRSKDELVPYLMQELSDWYDNKEKKLSSELMRQLERFVVLQVVDQEWKDHLYSMDNLQEGIGLRAYGQKDPLVEYKKESYIMFEELIRRIKRQISEFIFKLEPAYIEKEEENRIDPEQLVTNKGEDGTLKSKPKKRTTKKVGRNDPCPCGSGKKYKKCCGA
jgi:preprotein translocase subunit SecA